MNPEKLNQEIFNLSIRQFLKTVGISSQREIEQAVAAALARGAIKGDESLPAKMTLEIAGVELRIEFPGEIKLG